MIKTIQAVSLAVLMAGAAIPAMAQSVLTAPQTDTAQSDQTKPADTTNKVAHKKTHHLRHRTVAKKTEATPAPAKS